MAYEPKTWACGDTITADDLNHIEQGVAEAGGGGDNGVFVVTFGGNPLAPDVSFDKMEQAFLDGKIVVARNDQSGGGGYAYTQAPLSYINTSKNNDAYARFGAVNEVNGKGDFATIISYIWRKSDNSVTYSSMNINLG